jgi:hypothetical protein
MGLFGKSKFDRAFEPYEMPREKPRSFFQGGDKFTGRDAIAGLLAAVGDAFANQSGMPVGATEGLLGGRLSARKLAEQERARAAVMERLTASGMDPADANILAGDDAAVRQTIGRKYEPKSPPALQQNFEWWKNLPPEEQARFGQYQDVVRPRWMTGPDGLPYQMPTGGGGGGMPPGLDPNEWEIVPDQGGAGLPGAPRRFR